MVSVKITPENFQEEVLNSKIPVLIDFWAPWCAPCRMMGPVFENLSTEYEGQIKFVKINTQEEMELAEQFQIRGIPTLAMVKNGKEFNRFSGFAPKEILKQKIEEMM